jgi:hypothetical protein
MGQRLNLTTGEMEEVEDDPQDQVFTPPIEPMNTNSGLVLDLNTGEMIQPQQQTQQPATSLTERFTDLFTGELRQTEDIKGLPEVISLDLGSTAENVKLKSALAITPNDEEKIGVIKNIFPDAKFTTDNKENVIVDFGQGKKGVLNAPGVTLAGFGETALEAAAFIPAAIGAGKFTGIKTKAAAGVGGAGLTQSALEGLQTQFGGTFDKDEIAIASALGGVAEVVLPAIQAFRQSKRAGQIGAQSDEVAKAIESISPTKKAVRAIKDVTGVDIGLFRAQQTGIPSELLKQRILPQLDAGARLAAERLEKQNKDVFKAVTGMINTIAPKGSIVKASKRFKDTAEKAIEARKQTRRAGTKELYKDAFDFGADVDLTGTRSLVDDMLADAPVGSEFNKTGNKLLSLISPIEEGVKPTLRQLQKAKMTMQDMINDVGEKAVSPSIKREIAGVKKELVKQMGIDSPLFKKADEEFARLSPAVAELEDSLIGQVAKLKDTQLKTIAQKIFDPKTELTDPQSIKDAKRFITEVDPAAWDDLLRVEMNRRIGGLEQLIEDIPGDFVGNIPGQLRRSLFGNPPTAAFGQAIEKMKGVAVVVRDMIFRPLSTIQEVGERGIFDRNVAAMTRIMFDPGFKPQMNKLKKLSPDSPAAARALTQMLNNAQTQDQNQ